MPVTVEGDDDEILATTGVRPPRRRKELEQAPRTTGSFWGDAWEAVKLINVKDDMRDIAEMPCARKSLMTGIASGVGVGVIRGVTVRPYVACNWAMGTFMLISISTWQVCRARRAKEMQQVAFIRQQALEKRRAAAQARQQQELATPA
ncbi:hypothetical protein AURDEDRAFT_135388 [Auricularia subglabra TFB-10046 SS5]|nr:hypothetical protein AURDEDRAFT_135388 [Auricularia subglabra TFB-10046 SS5]